MTQDELTEKISQFIECHQMAPSLFGLLSVNSTHLIQKMAGGRKLRQSTIDKIAAWMVGYDEEQRENDLAALGHIRKCGFVTVSLDGDPLLETNTQIDRKSFGRLIADGHLVPSGDALFGAQSQTYRPVSRDHG